MTSGGDTSNTSGRAVPVHSHRRPIPNRSRSGSGGPGAKHSGKKVYGDMVRHTMGGQTKEDLIRHRSRQPGDKTPPVVTAERSTDRFSERSAEHDFSSATSMDSMDNGQSSIPLTSFETQIMDPGQRTSTQVVTMTGTIKRGQKPGEAVQVQLQFSEHELRKLNHSSLLDDDDDKNPDCIWGLKKGLHILVLTVLFIPIAFIASLCMSFYIGTMCWYNVIVYLSEERTIWHKIFLCPVVILSYPFLVGLSAMGLGLYACVLQVSWYVSSWYKEVRDFEKGFYGWVCHKLHVSQCSPYEIVVLDEEVGSVIQHQQSRVAQTTV